ncbi:hydroxymethylcytosylglucuronate/cytosylglucuronate synthase [Streptomyces sp. NPDC006739]|uniref:hydroxymethylcytosylglucuronate/cytosylglucurona te synthase n=1 Tax=Streptomyces sp. NPDC006739 TaxID=3364763 RepID=UPI003682C809
MGEGTVVTAARHSSRPLRIIVSAVDFGWGSAGKLSSVLQALTSRAALEVIGVGTELGRPVLAGHGITEWRRVDPRRDVAGVATLVAETAVDLAVVVLDPVLATTLQVAGCPVVYIDSLPFLWTEHDPLPVDVALYCAQRTLPLPPAADRALARVKNLVWVAPIVPEAAQEPVPRSAADPGADGGYTVVNLGGLHSPFTHAGDHSYQRLVLEAALNALADLDATHVVITGNVEPTSVPAPPARLTVETRSCPHAEFTQLLARAAGVLTSPGLTTILELAALGRNAVLLPPQNLSQVFNGDLVALGCDNRLRIPWPEAVLRREEILAWHRRGEDFAVERIRSRITAAAASSDTLRSAVRSLTTEINNAVRWACDGAPSFSSIAQDFGGADQVAQAILSLASR